MRHLTTQREESYRAGLAAAARHGAAILGAGGPAIAACIAAVRSMESSGVFNAGVGCCLNRDGQIEADAAVMQASDLSIGAVAAVPGVANAVDLAEAVRTGSPHCLLVGSGAIELGRSHNVPAHLSAPAPHRLQQYRKLIERDGGPPRPRSADDLIGLGGTHDAGDTVGAVALDRQGGLACAVSTGGLWLKAPGRVGDSPLPGSGFWAADGVGVAVATGTGEFIIRGLLSSSVVHAVQGGQQADGAVHTALAAFSERFGTGKAGVIAVDSSGAQGFAFDTEGMGRAAIEEGSSGPSVAIWRHERP